VGWWPQQVPPVPTSDAAFLSSECVCGKSNVTALPRTICPCSTSPPQNLRTPFSFYILSPNVSMRTVSGAVLAIRGLRN
jgi:hypothetical protein